MTKIKAIVTDMDGTAINYAVYGDGIFGCSSDALSQILSEEERERWNSNKKFFLSQNLYDPRISERWFKADLELLKGKRLSEAKKFLFPVPYSNGFYEFFSFLNSNIKKGILSNGIGLVADKIKQELNFDESVGDYLEFKDGIFTGNGKRGISSLCKAGELKNMADRFGVALKSLCYIGDTIFDISCLNIAGVPIAFNPKYGLEKYAGENNIQIIHDFRELNNILEI
ncbi:MAG: HAD family hydrolase [Nanoarchaeota archaeon]